MYEGWTLERWPTPVSDLKSIALHSLIDDGGLSLTVEELGDPRRRRWRFRFNPAPIYLNVPEEYRLELWRRVHSEGRRYGWTAIVPNSPWLASLSANEPLISIHHPKLIHFQVGTEDDVIDVVSPNYPSIEELAPAAPNDPIPGKSHVYYHPEDRDKIEAIIESLRQKKRDA